MEAREEDEQRDEDPRIPDEVQPLDVELAHEAPGSQAAQTEDVDLNHLRNVLEEMKRLRQRKEGEKREPRVRDDPRTATSERLPHHGRESCTCPDLGSSMGVPSRAR